ncbi:MAG: PaaI family thioesterase [Sphingobium sp.]
MPQSSPDDAIDYLPSPDHPGWHLWQMRNPGHFNDLYGDVLLRTNADGTARVRIYPKPHLTNADGNIHGGALMGFVDICLFAGPYQLGVGAAMGAVTVDAQVQFVGAADLGAPVDALVEIVRETGGFVFTRGLVVQQDRPILSFTGLIKKRRSRS